MALDPENYKKFRHLMISLILATDMANHFNKITKIKSRVTAEDFAPKDLSSKGDKQLCMQLVFHLADISNTTKRWNICQTWIDLLFEEFFLQGDLERDLNQPITYLMDRETVNIAKSQHGFIDFMIAPSWVVLISMLPNLRDLQLTIKENRQHWTDC